MENQDNQNKGINKSKEIELQPAVGLYALWKYDLFPYVLIGEITKVCEKGKYPDSHCTGRYVCIKGFEGMAFPAIKIVSKEEGIIIKEKLNELKETYREAIMSLKNTFEKIATRIHGIEY